MIPDRSLIAEAQKLHLKGVSVRAIAEQLGIGRSSAHRFIKNEATPASLRATRSAGQARRRAMPVNPIPAPPAPPVAAPPATPKLRKVQLAIERGRDFQPRPQPLTEREIEEFLKTKGATRCPTVYLTPISQI